MLQFYYQSVRGDSIGMKYCPRCANIVSDKSNSRFTTECCNCHIPYEEDEMTGVMFESLSESEKEGYTISLLNQIKTSSLFDEKACYYGHPAFYYSYWFDKYEELMNVNGATAWRADRIETEEEHNQWLQDNFGKDSPAYQQAVIEQCIQTDRARKQESSNPPKCPTCQSTNIEKISLTKKAVGGALFGLFSSNVRKTFFCKDCGYKW